MPRLAGVEAYFRGVVLIMGLLGDALSPLVAIHAMRLSILH